MPAAIGEGHSMFRESITMAGRLAPIAVAGLLMLSVSSLVLAQKSSCRRSRSPDRQR
jgi:hypothetical protein